jgi:hypothetical protein
MSAPSGVMRCPIAFVIIVHLALLPELGAVTIPEVPKPDPTIQLDVSAYAGTYARPGARYEVAGHDGKFSLTVVIDPWQAAVLGTPERTTHELLPIDAAHFVLPPSGPLEDPQTVAIYDVRHGAAQFLYTNCRVFPRVRD